MSELGRFLEILYGPHEPFRTVRGKLREWCNQSLAEHASHGR